MITVLFIGLIVLIFLCVLILFNFIEIFKAKKEINKIDLDMKEFNKENLNWLNYMKEINSRVDQLKEELKLYP